MAGHAARYEIAIVIATDPDGVVVAQLIKNLIVLWAEPVISLLVVKAVTENEKPLRLRFQQQGHQAQIVDAQLEGLSTAQIYDRVQSFRPDFTVVTTAPSYLFWRCAPPELRIPQQLIAALRPVAGTVVIVGPHASTTPRATLAKTGADLAVIGECEEILPRLASLDRTSLSLAWREGQEILTSGAPHQSSMADLPALHWGRETIGRHRHHHHRFDTTPTGPGAEMETSRGCPYHCTFCAKDNFRNTFRRRPVPVIAEELDGLIADGAEYVYFIDEIFLPFRDVLQAIAERGIRFGIQTRIDLWNAEMIDLLGAAGCVSIEAGVTLGWERHVGGDGIAIGIDTFGLSAPAEDLFKHFGFTAEAIVPKIKAQLGI